MVEYCRYDNLQSYLLKNQGLNINQVDPYYGNYLLDFDSIIGENSASAARYAMYKTKN